MPTNIKPVALTPSALARAGGREDAPAVRLFTCSVEIEPNGVPCDFASQWLAVRQACSGWTKEQVRSHPVAACYFDFYRRLGINPNKTPPSAANLLTRFAIGAGAQRPLPQIFPAVDAGNVAQAENLVPVAIFDADFVDGEMILDLAVVGDTLLAFGYDAAEAVEPGRFVLRDKTKVLSEFCYRDGKAQAVKAETRRLHILACQVQGVDENAVRKTILRVVELLAQCHHIR